MILADFGNRHEGRKFVVVGCGPSAGSFDFPPGAVLIGVNDCEKYQTVPPIDYLLTLDGPNHFADVRSKYILSTKARYHFAYSRKWVGDNVVYFDVGRKGKPDPCDGKKLNFSNNSPFVATMLAEYMGATHIGIIGVDLSDKHALSHQPRRKAANYHFKQMLGRIYLDRCGPVIANLNKNSGLDALPKMTWEELVAC